jgi:hypothetical protein
MVSGRLVDIFMKTESVIYFRVMEKILLKYSVVYCGFWEEKKNDN